MMSNLSSGEMQNSWEQMDNESDENFEMFKIYRSLQPTERNLVKFWEVYSEREQIKGKAPKNLGKISETYKWYDRAIAFDSYYEGTLVNYASKDQFRDLIAFRKKQRDLASRLTEVSLGLIKLAQERLLKLKPEELTVGLLPKYIQTAVQITGMAMESEASALMLQDLATLMQNGATFTQEDTEETESDLSIWEDAG